MKLNEHVFLLALASGIFGTGVITALFGWSLKQGEPLLPDRMLFVGIVSIILGFSTIIYSVVKLSK